MDTGHDVKGTSSACLYFSAEQQPTPQHLKTMHCLCAAGTAIHLFCMSDWLEPREGGVRDATQSHCCLLFSVLSVSGTISVREQMGRAEAIGTHLNRC